MPFRSLPDPIWGTVLGAFLGPFGELWGVKWEKKGVQKGIKKKTKIPGHREGPGGLELGWLVPNYK